MEQQTFQTYRDVTIDVLKRKDPSAINTLKNFLRSSPSPKYMEQILMKGVLYFAQQASSVFSWIITHQDDLKPEIDLLAATRKLVLRQFYFEGKIPTGFSPHFLLDRVLVMSRITNHGWLHGKDFQIVSKNTLVFCRTSKATLVDCCSQPELLLINTNA